MCWGCACKIPISVYQSLGVYVSGVVCNSTVITHRTWPPDSNLDVTLPLGTSLLWETTRLGDTTKKYYGARVLLLVLETLTLQIRWVMLLDMSSLCRTWPLFWDWPTEETKSGSRNNAPGAQKGSSIRIGADSLGCNTQAANTPSSRPAHL